MSVPTVPVRTRFAPSPTGYMHIGGMRTALFNWLWARHMGGQFILRIDDTDQQRNVDAALQPIFRAFRWLGLTWDEGPEVEGAPYAPYYQSQRTHLYQAAADKLLAEGKAFRDFDPPELTQADRQAAEQSKQPFLNIRRSLDLSPADVEAKLAAGEPYVVRFLVPRDQKVAIDDAVRGHVEWDGALIADPVIQRSNGSVLYNFATVVDDAQMRISHVIRAEEHLTNTAVQALLHQALGNALPVFAHIPFITAPGSTKKLSKRDVDKLKNNPALKKMFERGDDVLPRLGFGGEALLNPVMVEYYERMGYLPAGILNTLARLGWSLDDKTEIFSLGDVVRDFTLERIVKNPAGLDADKLQSYQAHWMGQLSMEEKVAGVVPFLRRAGWLDDAGHIVPLTTSAPTPSGSDTITGELPAATREFLERLLSAMGDRLRIFSDVLETSEFFFADEALPYDAKAFEQRIAGSADARDILRAAAQALEAAPQFEPAPLEALLHDLCESRGLKLGQLVAPLRVATTGKSNGVGLGDTLSLLERERTLRRIARALDHAALTTTR